jgi:hypothetical protein
VSSAASGGSSSISGRGMSALRAAPARWPQLRVFQKSYLSPPELTRHTRVYWVAFLEYLPIRPECTPAVVMCLQPCRVDAKASRAHQHSVAAHPLLLLPRRSRPRFLDASAPSRPRPLGRRDHGPAPRTHPHTARATARLAPACAARSGQTQDVERRERDRQRRALPTSDNTASTAATAETRTAAGSAASPLATRKDPARSGATGAPDGPTARPRCTRTPTGTRRVARRASASSPRSAMGRPAAHRSPTRAGACALAAYPPALAASPLASPLALRSVRPSQPHRPLRSACALSRATRRMTTARLRSSRRWAREAALRRRARPRCRRSCSGRSTTCHAHRSSLTPRPLRRPRAPCTPTRPTGLALVVSGLGLGASSARARPRMSPAASVPALGSDALPDGLPSHPGLLRDDRPASRPPPVRPPPHLSPAGASGSRHRRCASCRVMATCARHALRLGAGMRARFPRRPCASRQRARPQLGRERGVLGLVASGCNVVTNIIPLLNFVV